MRRIVIPCCLLLLAGCASPLQELKGLNPSTDDFAGSLASEYLAYAESESEQGRKLIAEHYANKGLQALRGETVEPEKIDTSLPPQDQQKLTAARTQLMTLLTGDMKREAPQELARAQLLFDCWQHEIKKRINQELAPCEDEFKAAMIELDALTYDEKSIHTLTFAKTSARLTAEDRVTIKDIARQVAQRTNYALEIATPDTLGAKERDVAAARLDAVHKALLKVGVAEKYIRVKREADDKKVYLSCDVKPDNTNTVTVKILEAQ